MKAISYHSNNGSPGNASISASVGQSGYNLKPDVIAVNLPPVTGLHLRALEGMSICEAPGNCYYIMDPAWSGKKYPEPMFAFEAKYNYAVSMAGGAGWQIAHYW